MADQHDNDVASTLNELERKLRALESDLQSAVAEPQAAPEPTPVMPPPALGPERVIPRPLPPLTDGDPEQIVADARQRISDLRAELDELARTREQIALTANELVSDYNRALYDQPVAAPPIPQALAPEHTIQQGAVVIDAGFFRDVTSLSAFEQALARVPGVVGVHVRGFAQGRAIIDIQLSHPIPLGAELARYAPLRFTVTEAGPQHLMLAISA